MSGFLLQVSGADGPVAWWVWPIAVLVVVGAVLGMGAPRG